MCAVACGAKSIQSGRGRPVQFLGPTSDCCNYTAANSVREAQTLHLRRRHILYDQCDLV